MANILPMLTGETDGSPRYEIFYFSGDGDLTELRYDEAFPPRQKAARASPSTRSWIS